MLKRKDAARRPTHRNNFCNQTIMKVEKNKVVSVHYALRTEEGGPIVEQTTGEHLLEFLFGRGMMLQKFEDNLANLEEGQSVSFHLTPEEGYGEYHKEMVVNIPRQTFANFPQEMMKVGTRVPMQDNHGNHLVGHIVEINDNSVKMDFNHDMAGKDLYFTVEIKKIRDAEPEEIEHGHVHHEGHCCHGEGKCHKHDGEDGEHHCCHDDEDGEHHCHKHDEEDGEHHCHKHDEDGEHHCCHHKDE